MERHSGGTAEAFERRACPQSDADLVGRIKREYVRVTLLGIPVWEAGRYRAGSFPSLNEANEWVNKTLDVNRAIVDEVASGRREEAFLTHRFGFVTGREAIVADRRRRTIITRRTYGVGVSIYHDKRSPRGFSVTTAYPRNDDQ